jgi:hypothetical protein
MKLSTLLEDAYSNTLSTSTARRNFIFNSPKTAVTRQSDKMKLAKTKDLNVVKQDLEYCFERMITALSSTTIQGVASGKINQLRSQLFSLIDAEATK